MKPIIFCTDMVKALLNTKPGVWPAEPIDASKPCKSQTRLVIKPQPEKDGRFWKWHTGMWNEKATPILAYGHGMYNRMPIKPGDILYVRETWADIEETSPGNIHYKASATEADIQWFKENGWKWRPSIHMPREAARLFLEVKSVRVERLHDISEADAEAEGVEINHHCVKKYKNPKIIACVSSENNCVDCDLFKTKSFKAGFQYLWNSINAKRSYSLESNPWVWVYEFARVER